MNPVQMIPLLQSLRLRLNLLLMRLYKLTYRLNLPRLRNRAVLPLLMWIVPKGEATKPTVVAPPPQAGTSLSPTEVVQYSTYYPLIKFRPQFRNDPPPPKLDW